MHVCLIIPPSPFLLDERVFMSLGVLKVAAVLEEAGIPVTLVDLSGFDLTRMALALPNEATHFGFTATTPQIPAVVRMAQQLRLRCPMVPLILGGPHVTLVHAAAKKERGAGRATLALRELVQNFDVLVCGDGEKAIFAALRDNPPNMIDADDAQSPYFLTDSDVTDLPPPARHLIDIESYHYEIEGVRALSLIAQLGCPFGCGFCGGRKSPFLRRIRTRTTKSVCSEILHLHQRYGACGFMFYDDELNVSPSMVELMQQITLMQRALGVQFHLRGFIKAELFTDQQADAIVQAGFRWILVGFESAHPRILTNIQKKATLADNTRCLHIAKRHGLKVKALMSLGHPGESPETIEATRQWLMTERPDDFDATVITTYPGTPYHDEASETAPGMWTYTAKTGDRLHTESVDYLTTAEYYKGIPGSYVAHVWTDALTREDLVIERDALEADVRKALGLAYPTARTFDHSMGQA